MSVSRKIRNSLLLVLAAAIWGFAFAFQRLGGEAMGPLTMNGLRSLIGVLVLLPILKVLYGSVLPDKDTLTCGVLCGLVLTAACNLQQAGLMYTSPGKAGFITAAYMIIVAVISIFTGRKPGLPVIAAIILGTVGLFLICVPDGESLTVNKGDLLCIGCAVAYALQIVIIDHYGERIRPVKMTAVQFLVAGIISTILAFLFEEPTFAAVKDGLIPLLYVGVMSTAGAYSFQVVGMQGLNPAVSSLIMSLESVFSVIGEFVIFGTMLSGKALTGCMIMFLAILLSQSDLIFAKRTEMKQS